MNPLILPLMLLVLFSPLGIDLFLTSIPAMQQDFDADPSSIQLTISLFVLAMGLGQLLIGPLADRYGRKPVALGGIMLFLVSSLGIALTEHFVVLLILRMLQGIGACSTSIAAFSVVRDRFDPREGARIYSYLNGSLNVVPAMAPLLGAMLAGYWGWQSNFYFLSVFGLVVLAVIWWQLPETHPDTRSDASSGRTERKKTYSLSVYIKIVSHPQFAYYALCTLTGMGMVLSYVIFSTQVLIVELGMSSHEFSLLFGANALVLMLASFLTPKVIAAIGRRNSVSLGGAVMLVSGVLMAVIYGLEGSSIAGFMGPVILGCIGFALLVGSSASLALEHFGDNAGTAAALHGCFMMLGASLISMVALSIPLVPNLAQAVVMVVMGGICMLGLGRHHFGATPRQESEPANS